MNSPHQQVLFDTKGFTWDQLINKNFNTEPNMNGLIPDITRMELFNLGIKEGSTRMVDTIEEIGKDPPNIVIAECIENIAFVQNRFKQQRLTKKVQYCMGLGVYIQLRYDTRRGNKILKPGRFKFKNVYRPYKGQSLNNKTLLLWRTGGVGDLIFINPICRYLKGLYPTCKIKLACGPQYQPMVENFDVVDEVLNLPFSSDLLFSSHYHGVFEGVIERTREAQKTNAYELFARSLQLPIPPKDLIPHQKPKQDKLEECRKILDEWGIKENEFVILQPRASSPIRTPNYNIIWRPIINKITTDFGLNVIITDSPHQQQRLDLFIKDTIDNKDKVFNFCGISKSLDYTIAMTSLSKMAISTDSALIHIAASLGVKVFGLYGPFPSSIRMSTYSNCDWIEPEKDKCDCMPCFKHGHLPCKNSDSGGHPICYNFIDPKKCFDKIENLLKD